MNQESEKRVYGSYKVLKLYDGIHCHTVLIHYATEIIKPVHCVVKIADSAVACIYPPRFNDSSDKFDSVSCRLNIELIWMQLLMKSLLE